MVALALCCIIFTGGAVLAGRSLHGRVAAARQGGPYPTGSSDISLDGSERVLAALLVYLPPDLCP